MTEVRGFPAAQPGSFRHPIDAVRPRWRGLLHAWAAPIAFAVAVALLALADTSTQRFAAVLYGGTLTALFAVSAAYHRAPLSARVRDVLARIDHSMIFLFIAATYTAFGLLLLHGTTRAAVLGAVWGGAVTGAVIRSCWQRAPRWLVTPLYVALGWTAAFVVPDLLRTGGIAFVVLTIVGGAIYTFGGTVYTLRWPNPAPRVFGYHEVFHLCTLVAAICHVAAVFLAILG